MTDPLVLLDEYWPHGCPRCTADRLYVTFDCGSSGDEIVDAMLKCDGCGTTHQVLFG